MPFSISKTQQAWLESFGATIGTGALTALVPYLTNGMAVNWSAVTTAGVLAGALALQAALRGLAQPGPQGPLAPAGTPEPPK